MEKGSHVVSLSLGTVAEPSGLVVVNPRTQLLEPGEDGRRDSENYFDVTWIRRFPAGCPIPEVVARVAELISDKLLAKKCSTLLDITSTGVAPRRVFEARGLHPTLIDLANTGSEERSNGMRRVPVRNVIGAAQVVLQTHRLKVASALDLASTLVGDLQSFDPKSVDRGLDLRGGRNSDLVLALAVAVWWADKLTWNYDPVRTRPVSSLGVNAWMGN